MNPRLKMTVELETLHSLLDELDYYTLMQLDPDCEPDAVGNAFRQESRRLHPDRIAALRDEDLKTKANAIFRLVNEAYRTLKDPEQRARYDALLAEGEIRMNKDARANAQRDKHAGDPAHAVSHPKAEKYWKMALRDIGESSWKSAVMNIKFAMNFEPDNAVMKEHLERAEKNLVETESKKEKNPYKLRIM